MFPFCFMKADLMFVASPPMLRTVPDLDVMACSHNLHPTPISVINCLIITVIGIGYKMSLHFI